MISFVSSTILVSDTRSETVISSAETTPAETSIKIAASAAITIENVFFIISVLLSLALCAYFFLNYSNLVFIISKKKIKTKGGFNLDWTTILSERVKEGIRRQEEC